jgi:hypothetical protein
MKKKIYFMSLTGAILILAQSLMAQSKLPEISLFGAVNKSSIIGDSESWKDPFGAMGGAIVNVTGDMIAPFAVLVEINLSMQGARWEDDWGEGLVKGVTRMLYLNFPVVARYLFNNGLFFEAGIQPGLLLSAKDKYQDVSYDVKKDWFKGFDFSIPLGVGYMVTDNIGVAFRIIPGVSNINNSDYDEYKDHNFVVAVRGIYTIGGKK